MFTNRVYTEVGEDKTDLEQDSLGKGDSSKDLRSILLTQYISYKGLKCPETVSYEVPHHFVESVVKIIKVNIVRSIFVLICTCTIEYFEWH